MREILGPPLRAAALTAFIIGLVLLFLHPPSFAWLGGLLALLVGAVAVVLLTAWVPVVLFGEEMPDSEFRRVVYRSAVGFAYARLGRHPTVIDIVSQQSP